MIGHKGRENMSTYAVSSSSGDYRVNPNKEYVDKRIKEEYEKQMKIIQDIALKRGEYTPEDYEALKKAMGELEKMAKDGSMDGTMITNMKNVFSILGPAMKRGDHYVSFDEFKANMKTLKGFKGVDGDGNEINFTALMLSAIGDARSSDMTVMEQLFTILLKEATERYEAEMEKLKAALTMNLDITKTLTAIQNLRNQWANVPKDGITDGTNPIPIDVVLPPGAEEELKDLIEKLEKQLKKLEELNPGSSEKTGTLANDLKLVIGDLTKATEGGIEGIKDWVMDGRKVVGGGAIQNRLSAAIENSGKLNQDQMAELNKLNVGYEQHVKISTSLMQALSDIIKKFAAGAK